jgi:glycerophosphoryl diester phosphodiesterase
MTSSPLLLGHRGTRISQDVAENTLPSFDLALKHGCDGFEFDVRLTACGHAVICHDSQHRGIRIAEAVRAELPELPLLEEVLAHYGDRAFLDVELKVAGLEEKVLSLLRQRQPQRPYVISSFLRPVLMELRGRSAIIPLGLICDSQSQLMGWRAVPVEYVIPEYSLVTQSLVHEVHAAGKLLLVWTVNDPAAIRRMSEFGVDGIISDDTQTLVRTIRLNGKPA